tara:strand:- start:59 stop:544 length:486 start_codon:yes stop_codon:yes gene_type:complete
MDDNYNYSEDSDDNVDTVTNLSNNSKVVDITAKIEELKKVKKTRNHTPETLQKAKDNLAKGRAKRLADLKAKKEGKIEVKKEITTNIESTPEISGPNKTDILLEKLLIQMTAQNEKTEKTEKIIKPDKNIIGPKGPAANIKNNIKQNKRTETLNRLNSMFN